jgi:hypothetical protein
LLLQALGIEGAQIFNLLGIDSDLPALPVDFCLGFLHFDVVLDQKFIALVFVVDDLLVQLFPGTGELNHPGVQFVVLAIEQVALVLGLRQFILLLLVALQDLDHLLYAILSGTALHVTHPRAQMLNLNLCHCLQALCLSDLKQFKPMGALGHGQGFAAVQC